MKSQKGEYLAKVKCFENLLEAVYPEGQTAVSIKNIPNMDEDLKLFVIDSVQKPR